MVCSRGNADNSIMDMLRQKKRRLDGVETIERRGVHLNDVSDDGAHGIPNPNLEPKVESN